MVLWEKALWDKADVYFNRIVCLAYIGILNLLLLKHWIIATQYFDIKTWIKSSPDTENIKNVPLLKA